MNDPKEEQSLPAQGPFEGVRPRQAVCPSCGYVPGGAAIQRGVVQCPECGERIEFVLRAPKRSRWVVIVGRMGAGFALGIGVWIGVTMWVEAGAMWALAYTLIACTVSGSLWLVGNRMLRTESRD